MLLEAFLGLFEKWLWGLFYRLLPVPVVVVAGLAAKVQVEVKLTVWGRSCVLWAGSKFENSLADKAFRRRSFRITCLAPVVCQRNTLFVPEDPRVEELGNGRMTLAVRRLAQSWRHFDQRTFRRGHLL